MCNNETERPAKRLKMGISVQESFINDLSVNNLDVDFENHTHHITSAKMSVSVADFSSLPNNEANGFINPCALHQHTALQSEWLLHWNFSWNGGMQQCWTWLVSHGNCSVIHWKFEFFYNDISDVFLPIGLQSILISQELNSHLFSIPGNIEIWEIMFK